MSSNKKRVHIKRAAFIAIIALSAVFQYSSIQFGFLDFFNNHIYDVSLKFANIDKNPSPNIAIVLVDEASLEALENEVGRWPWDRRVWGKLIEFFSDAGAKNIYFDILFSEYSKPPFEGTLEVGDQSLVSFSEDAQNVVHAIQLIKDTEDKKNKKILNRKIPKNTIKFTHNLSRAGEYNNYYFPFKELQNVSSGLGVVEFSPDTDGVFRQTELLKGYNNSYFKLLPVTKVFSTENFIYQSDRIVSGDLNIPLKNYKFKINFNPNISTYSISGIMTTIAQIDADEIDDLFVNPEVFEGRDIFIGTSAAATHDIKTTPFGLQPGVLLHASILDSIHNREFITELGSPLTILITMALCFSLTFFILFSKRIFYEVIVFFFISGLVFFSSFVLFKMHYLWINTGIVFITLVFCFILAFIYRTFYENKDKRFLKAVFKNYISPELIEIMHETGDMPKLGGDVGPRTAFFTDIQSFSTFSEQLSPDELVEVLNEYLTEMTDVLIKQRGTLDKFVGDAIVAFFGAPHKQDDHAIRACIVALNMQMRLKELRQRWRESNRTLPELVQNMAMRIGINSGQILAGNMGATGRMNYTIMGDAVNLAARLESSAKQYGVLIQITKETLDQTDGRFLVRKLDRVIVKGRTIPTDTYELLGYKNQDTQLDKLVKVFNEGFELYLKQKFEQAISKFVESLELEDKRFGDYIPNTSPSLVYINRCNEYKKTKLPKDWNGSYTMVTK